MRLGNSCSKGGLPLRPVALLVACLLLIGTAACGGAPEAGRSPAPEPGAESTAADEAPVTAEETQAPESAADPAEENTPQAAPDSGTETEPDGGKTNEEDGMKSLRMEIDGTEIPVVWEDNESVAALAELAAAEPLTVQMSMYGGFEQVGPLGTSLPRNDQQTTTSAGDIVLYAGDQIVVFYGSNSWAYTRLGHMELSPAEISELLSQGEVTLALSAG